MWIHHNLLNQTPTNVCLDYFQVFTCLTVVTILACESISVGQLPKVKHLDQGIHVFFNIESYNKFEQFCQLSFSLKTI